MATQQILVIDDDPGMGRSVCQLLEQYGYTLEYVSEGKLGLSRLNETNFDILILDLNIPDMSGIEVLTHLKKLKHPVKTIVLSGESEVQVVTPVLRLGAYDYLSKPYQPAQLIGSVRNAISEQALEHKNAALQIEREDTRKRYEFLLNASPDLIYLLNPEGQFTFVNNQLRQVFDFQDDEILGKTWNTLLEKQAANELQYYFNERRSGERSTKELEFTHTSVDGKQHTIELSAMGVYALTPKFENTFEGTYGILRDVTRARELTRQQERAKADKSAIETQLQQSSKMEAIGRLAGGIAHDFNNILATIIGYTELSIAPPKPLADQVLKKYLSEVLEASQQARDLISQMLSFSRTSRWNAGQTNVENNLSKVSRMLRAAIPSNITLDTRFAENLPDIFIDPAQLQQVVVNLIINATDAIKGAGRIGLDVHGNDISEECASCGERFSGNFITLSVSDTGERVPAELHKRIFNSLVSASEPGRAGGFGLWQVHNIIHEYGGHVSISSMPESGARFSVHLPEINANQEQLGEKVEHEETTKELSPCGKILVIDEEVSLSKLIGELLSNSGYEVVLLNSSAEAIEFIRRNHKQLAMVITDQEMPQLSGIQIAEQSKSIAPQLPIVVMTGFADEKTINKIQGLNIDGILSKPFNVDELQKIVRKLAHTYKHA